MMVAIMELYSVVHGPMKGGIHTWLAPCGVPMKDHAHLASVGARRRAQRSHCTAWLLRRCHLVSNHFV